MMMTVLQKNLQETLKYLKSKGFKEVETGIVLGTGLGQLVNHLEIETEAHYNNIPFFPQATVEFHSGKLIYGTLSGKKVVVMSGRHYYEGYNMQEVTYGIRTMQLLGVKNLIISNAAGAINRSFEKGNLMLIDDHINLQGDSPLAYKGVEVFGPRFTDMSAPYDKVFSEQLLNIARANNIPLHQGVYAAVVGPQLETRAEYRYLKIIGADAVGMSTVPEVIAANQMGMRCVAISVLTDDCDPDNLQPVNIQDIIETANRAEPSLVMLVEKLLQRM